VAEITIDNVRKNCGSLEVLHGVSAKVEDAPARRDFVGLYKHLRGSFLRPVESPAKVRRTGRDV